jgi:hypothetical protein
MIGHPCMGRERVPHVQLRHCPTHTLWPSLGDPAAYHPALRERELLPWLDTRAWRQHTTRPPASLTVPPPTLGQTLIGFRTTVLPVQRAASTSHATSPPLPMVSARHPTLRQQEPAPPQRARVRTVRMLRVTDAPTPLCVGSRRSRCSVEGGVQVKVEEL